MRADRLISLLLLLQRHDTVTVAQAAAELEISPRTARRDFEALMIAGVPVYSSAGRGGGWRLIGGATTDLSGLHEQEAQSLLVAAGMAARTLGPERADAVRKLVQALPEPFRESAATLADRTMSDEQRWGGDGRDNPTERPAAFAPTAKAVANKRKMRFGYRDKERLADPLGMIHKSGQWYLLADTADGRRNFRLDRMSDPEVVDEPATIPADFDLEAAWSENLAGFGDATRKVMAKGTIVDSGAVRFMRRVFGGRLTVEGDRFEVWSWSVEAVARELASFGNRLLVEDSPDVEAELATIGRQLVDLYR